MPLLLPKQQRAMEKVLFRDCQSDFAKVQSTKKKRLLREFYVTGAIKQDRICFFVLPDESNKQLLDCINSGSSILFHGVRGSGKTTRCLFAIENQLPNYCSLYVSLQAMEINDTTSFWTTFANRLLSYNSAKFCVNKITITNAQDFLELFKLFEKPVVLFVDEFDLLLYGEEKTRAVFLDCLAELKKNRNLHSFVAIGPLKIIDVTKETKIFSESILTCPTFTWEETQHLFLEYANEYNCQISDLVVQDIWKRTGGHAGQICLCGKVIHETIKNKLDFKEWIQFAVKHLPTKVAFQWQISSRLQQLEKEEKIRDLLLNCFLANHKIRLNESHAVQIAIDLSTVGVLTGDPSTNEFWIPSPLIRAVVWSSLPIHGQLSVLPPIEHGLFNVVSLIKNGLPLFNRNAKRDTEGPNALVYQVELMILLHKWFGNLFTWQIETEADAEGNCNIIITKEQRKRYLLELVTSNEVKENSLEGHYNRAQF